MHGRRLRKPWTSADAKNGARRLSNLIAAPPAVLQRLARDLRAHATSLRNSASSFRARKQGFKWGAVRAPKSQTRSAAVSPGRCGLREQAHSTLPGQYSPRMTA
ncbi:hypothetical protein MTO96_020551 [Rhipicephalus appendiculatus]